MAATHAADARPLIERISEAPVAGDDARAAAAVSGLQERAKADAGLAPLAAALANPRAAALLAGIFAGSPYLSGLIDRDLGRLQGILTTAPEARMRELKAELADKLSVAEARADVMRVLRRFKSEVALLTALADLAGVWPCLLYTSPSPRD